MLPSYIWGLFHENHDNKDPVIKQPGWQWGSQMFVEDGLICLEDGLLIQQQCPFPPVVSRGP